ncbi:MAG: Gfo/Idh/MocA family oxidoreductase [Pirellulales bacterium]|nr:Gfo/Idh/MocA family oxidoreductase [Pirellulales bacterium]
MKVHTVGIIMNGVTGRMGTNQHLVRSILAIRQQGGVRIGTDETIMPEPILVGRNDNKLRKLSERYDVEAYTTDLDSVLADNAYPVYFDALSTNLRVPNVLKAVAAGKHVYVEKPTAMNTDDAMSLYRAATMAGVKHGVVQDKLWLPGLRKLKFLFDTGFFGRLLSVRGEFGYFVFDGLSQPAQRPSWNYRKEDGGGIFFDMFSHWRYVIDNLFGEVKRLVALGAIHLPQRADEQGRPYNATADDAAYAIFETAEGVAVQFNSSWCTRVRRDDLLTIQVDGMKGTAVAGLRKCLIQPEAGTPKPVWNPDIEPTIDYFADWQEVPSNVEYDNAFKAQWELFLRHLVQDTPFPWTLLEGAKGVQLAELGLKSWQQRCWVDVPPLV